MQIVVRLGREVHAPGDILKMDLHQPLSLTSREILLNFESIEWALYNYLFCPLITLVASSPPRSCPNLENRVQVERFHAGLVNLNLPEDLVYLGI